MVAFAFVITCVHNMPRKVVAMLLDDNMTRLSAFRVTLAEHRATLVPQNVPGHEIGPKSITALTHNFPELTPGTTPLSVPISESDRYR
jgi:hypothetical protein